MINTYNNNPKTVRKMKKTLLTMTAAALLVGCQPSDVFNVPESQLSYDFPQEGGTVFVSVEASLPFTATTDAEDWTTVEVYEGKSTSNLRISVSANENVAERTATVTLESGSFAPIAISLRQSGAAPMLECTPKTVSLTSEEKEFTLTVTANCDFTMTTPQWVELRTVNGSDPENGSGNFTPGTWTLGLITTGEMEEGTTRKDKVSFSGSGLVAEAEIEQVAQKMETVTMVWGLEDIQYIWGAFGNVKTAISPTVVAGTDFSAYPALAKEDYGFSYTNESGKLMVVISDSGEFKIGKAGSTTSKGNINRDGVNVERMQMNKATEAGENCFAFMAPRSGSLEIEAAAPSSGERTTAVTVGGEKVGSFTAKNAIPSQITTLDITVTGSEGAEVRMFSTDGAVNYFQIKYTYKRPVSE